MAVVIEVHLILDIPLKENSQISKSGNVEGHSKAPGSFINGLGMSRATILESGVVIRFEFFELQPFKVDQFFRGFFRDFLTLIKL